MLIVILKACKFAAIFIDAYTSITDEIIKF